ncbi:hypothetical protein BHE74_00037819 [Ensete ventricosum]|nr:hypothetical protein BHE74_00037819 [Ensete ventricosum]RZR78978.1 hypothetical protein BHM03_00004541 [Ensete ventricosum]
MNSSSSRKPHPELLKTLPQRIPHHSLAPFMPRQAPGQSWPGSRCGPCTRGVGTAS